MKNKLRRNIQVLYGFSFFWLALVIIPVIVPFFESKGLSLAEVYYLQAIFAFIVVVFEVPSGYFADVFGRKNALVVGSVFHALGYTVLNFSEGFAGLVFFEATVGIGLSLLSGADLSLLYDSQEALDLDPAEKGRGIGNMRTIKSVAEGCAALLGGFLVAFSFEAVIFANTLFAWMPLLLSFLLVEAPFTKMEKGAHIGNLKKVLRFLYVDDRLLRLICMNITFFGLATFYVIWMLQPYWRDQDVPFALFGVLWAAQSFVVAATSKLTFPLEEKFGAKPMLILMGVLPIIGYWGMAGMGGLIGIVLSFSFFVSRGINQVLLTDALNSRVPSAFRATANSMTSFMFRGVYIVTGPVVGYSIDQFGTDTVLWGLGGAIVLVVGLFLLPLLSEIELLQRGVDTKEEIINAAKDDTDRQLSTQTFENNDTGSMTKYDDIVQVPS
ncbi:MAG: MFS transporter [Pseudomonadales bacterium]|nr:MFS transporter [Pseudomonadales bacterium]